MNVIQNITGGGTTEKKKVVKQPTNTSSAYNAATNIVNSAKTKNTYSNLNTTKTLNVAQNKTTTNNPSSQKTVTSQPSSAYNHATKPAASFFDTYKQSLGQNNTVKPTTKTRNDFGSDNDYEDYLYQNKVDLTKGDAFGYVSGKAKETGIHPRDYAGDMYYKAKNRQETNQTLAKETEARNNRIANNEGYEERLYSISDENGNSMSLSDYKNNVSTFENDYTTLQNDAKALSDKFNVDKNYAEYIAGYDALLKREQELQERYNNLSTYSKVSYNESYSQKYEENLQKIQELTAQSRFLRAQGNLEAIKPLSEEISRLQAENATISDLKNDVQSLQETDYYNYLKENGSEQEILDFERLMSHKDDNVAERLFNSFSTQTFGMLYQSTLDLYDIAKDLGGEVIGSLTETAVNALNSKGLIDDETLGNLEKVASDLKSFDWTADDNYSQVIRKWRQTSGYENMYGAGEMERNVVETLSGSADSVARYNLFGYMTKFVSGFVAATDKYVENINNGYSPEVSLANATITGVINTLSEMSPTENWMNIANNKAFEYISSGLGRMIMSGLSQGFEESLETIIEEGGDYITDYITYTLFGTNEEQKPHFEKDDLLRACMISFASGGLVGGLEMGKNVVIDTYNKNQAFKTLLSNNIGKITSLEEKNAMVEAIGELEWCLSVSDDKVINKNIELVKTMAEEKIHEFENSSVLAKSVKPVGNDVEANINATIQENINFEAQALAPELINGAKQQELNDIQVAKNESFISAVETVKKVNDYATLSMMSDYGVNMDPRQYRELDADIRESVNTVSKYAKRLNIDVAFDNNLNNMTVQADYGLRQSGVNGYNNKGQIVLNPNIANPQTVVLVHEITHNLEYSKYYGSLSELIKNSEGYEQIYSQAARTYEGIGNIENEANAIYMEKNFGNENFIKRIIRYNESLAYRIFKDIQSMVSSDEKTLIENAWAKVFKDVQNIELNNIVSYSVDELNTKKILSDYGITDEELSNGNVVARKIYDRLVAMKNSFISTEDRTILIVNKETGKEFIVSKAAIDETFGKPTTFFHKSKKRKRAMIAVADKIGYFIENGKVIKDNVKNYHNENGSPYIYIGHPVNIEGTDYYVTLMLKYSRDGNRLHIYKMDLAEKIGPLSKAISEDSPGFSEPKNNISQTGDNVKRSLDDNLAYHYNDGTTFDINKKAETLFSRGGRGTGAFGTGNYFFGDKQSPDSSYGKKGEHAITFTGYNLFRPNNKNDGYKLHDFFKDIENYYNPNAPTTSEGFDAKVNDILTSYADEDGNIPKSEKENLVNELNSFMPNLDLDEVLAKSSSLEEDELQDSINEAYNDWYEIWPEKYYQLEQWYNKRVNSYDIEFIKNELEWNNVYNRYKNRASYNGDVINQIPEIANILGTSTEELTKLLEEHYNGVEEDYKNMNLRTDSFGTRIMKSLGYEGIDVRGIEGLDNSTYGSVIYDIKPNTVKYSLSEKKRSLNSNKQSIKNYLANILGVNFNRTYLNTTKLLNELTEQIATTGEYNQETYNNFKNAIWEAMKVRRGNEAYDPSKIRSFLKDNPILRSQVEAADKRYLASNFGAFTFSNKGTSFDTLMAEFNELFPGLINPNEINSARDFIDAVQAQIYQLDSAKNDYVVPDVEFNMSAEELYKFFESKLDDAMGIYADDIKNLNEKYKTYDEKVNDVLKLINNPNVTADTFNKINNYEAITNAEFEGIKDAKDILLNNVDKWIKNYDVVKEQFGMFDNDTISNICYDIMMNGEISADTKDKMLNSLSSDQTFEGADTDINEQAEMIGDEIANLLYEKATGTKTQNDTPEDTMAKYQGNIEQYGAFAPGATPRQDIQVPKATEHGPTSQFARNVAETPGIISDDKSMEILANAVNNGELSYKALTNKALMDDAAKKLNMRGLDAMYNEVINNHNLNARTFTEEMTVLTELAKVKDYDRMKTVYLKLQDEATTMGQGLQTFTLLKKMSPEVQLMAAEKMMERMQNELDQQYGNKAVKLEIPENLKNNLLNAETEEEQAIARSAIQKELLNQQPKKLGDILNAWRYLSMLGNPRTHIRNILGNALFSPLVDIKNTIATGIENLVGSKLEHKTKAIVGFSKEDMALKQLGKEHYRTAILVNDQKYETKNFGNSKLGNLLNKLSNANSTAMDKEDFIFSSSRFAQSFASYIKSNGYTAENVPQDVLSKAIDYATLEAQKATYRDFNAGAEWLNKAEKSKSKLLRLSKQALVPFTKTPMNIIRRGVEYSPLGLMKTITADAYNLSQGEIDANTFIDNLSAGMTGTMISILGATLASIGIFRTKDDDKDRKQMFDEDNGEQDYCIDLSPFGIEGTYTIDWATPDIMPLAIGAELYDIFMKSEGIDGFEDTMDAVATISAKVFDPIFDTSMLSSLQSALKSYANGGGEWVGNIVGSMVSSYILQFIPTLSGQIARAVDDTRRTTYPNTGLIDKTIKQALNKIPGLSILNEPYINRSGEEEKNTGGNFFGRLIYNMVSPGYYQNKEIDKYDEEYYRLYESTGLLDAFPSSSVTSTTYDKEQYKLTDKEYTEWNKTRWSLEKEMVSDFIDSESYQYYSDEERVETIKDIRTYAQKVAKEKLLNGRGVEYTDANYEKLKNIAENMDIKDYFNYNNFSGTKQAEKIEYLENSDLSQEEKELLYSTEGYKTSYADAYAKVFGESKTNRSTKTSKTTNKTSTKKTSIKVPTTKTTKQTAYTQGTKVNTQNVNTSDFFTYRYNFLKSAAQSASQGNTKVVCPVCGQPVIPVDGKCPVCGASL